MIHRRTSGLALIAGTATLIVTMLLHPSAHDLFTPGEFEGAALRNTLAHSLALLGLPLTFFGLCGLARSFTQSPTLALGGLVLQGFGLAAVMVAAVASGLVATSLAREIVDSGSAASEIQRALFHFNGSINQAFAAVHVVASSLALLVWSLGMLRGGDGPRWVAVYGCVLAPLTLLAFLSGHVRLDVHGFGLIVLGQAVWMVACGVSLCRSGDGGASATLTAPSDRSGAGSR